MKKHKICLLLTACIAPPQTTQRLNRHKAEEREQDYYTALQQWLPMGYPIVFCESSLYQSERIQALVAQYPNQVEYLSFMTQKSVLGKGNGEAEILEYAFKHSTFVQETEWVAKVTGRLFVPNFKQVLGDLSQYAQAQVISDLNIFLSYADTRLVIFRPSFYPYFQHFFDQINENQGLYFEHAFVKAIHLCLTEHLHAWRMFAEKPIIVGISGTSNELYGYPNVAQRLRIRLAHALKKYLVSK